VSISKKSLKFARRIFYLANFGLTDDGKAALKFTGES
jgi:hypothetical protein